MARSQTKQIFRKVSRRIRFYLPLALLLLFVMVLYLPLSAPWMARWAENRLSAAIGAEVTFERLEFTLATATLDAYGVTIGGEGENDPFRVARVGLDGSLRGLLAGGGRWPAEVILEGVSPLEVSRDESGGWVLDGAGKSLLEVIGGERSETTTTENGGIAMARTPRVTLRQAEIRTRPTDSNNRRYSLILAEGEVHPRDHADAPLHLGGRGIFVGDSIEDFNFQMVWLPSQGTFNGRAEISGMQGRVPFPALQGLDVAVNDLSLSGHVTTRGDRTFDIGINASAGAFELAESRVGGETWRDEGLDIRIKFMADLATPRVRLDSLRLMGDEIEVTANGELELKDDYQGDIRLGVNRLPSAALTLGRRELREATGIQVLSAGTSPTLTLSAHASGPFAKPMELTEEISLRLGGWMAEIDELPGRLELEMLELDITPGSMNLARLDMRLEELEVSARGNIPVYNEDAGDTMEPGTLRLEARGDASQCARWLAVQGLLPREIIRLDIPVDLGVSLPLALVRSVGEHGPTFQVHTSQPRGQVHTGRGTVVLRDLSGAVNLEPALLEFTPGRLELKRLEMETGGITVLADLILTNLDLLDLENLADIHAEGDVVLRGSIRDMITKARRMGLIDRLDLPPDLDGMVRADLSILGRVDDPDSMDYRGRIDMEGVSATIQTRYTPIHVSRLDTSIRLDREELEVRRFELETTDEERGNSRVNLRARVTNEAITIEGDGKTRFEVLTSVLARELSDLVMEGPLPGTFTLTATPREGLGEGTDLLRRWLNFLGREDLKVSIRKDADLVIDYHVVYNQPYVDDSTDVRVFAREFPVPISGIRGNAMLTPDGVFFENCRVHIGSSRDVRVSGHVHIAPPVRITFDAVLDDINIDEWTEGWGEQPWASPPVTFEPRWRSFPEAMLMVQIDGKIRAKRATFMRFTGSNIQTDFNLKLSSRRPPRLQIANMSADLYDGSAVGDLFFLFPPAQRPWMRADVEFENVNIHRFIFDLHEHPEEEYDPNSGLDGKLTGDMVFNGQLLNYPTYTGEGNFHIVESGIIGQVILPYARNIIRIGTPRDTRMGTIRGDGYMEDQRIYFNTIEVVDPAMLLTANGYIDFQSRLFFEVSASVFSQRLRNIPLVQYVGDIIDLVGKEAVYYYNLRGTLGDPNYFPVPRIVDHADRLGRLIREGASLFGVTGPQDPPPAPNRR
ncbi:MAG: hypothetical protein JJU11_09775 [Candidatus Sumerlaeia bacterium]|nr:hypothetical protein [Candidatus Sumerlaeia bacterium]